MEQSLALSEVVKSVTKAANAKHPHRVFREQTFRRQFRLLKVSMNETSVGGHRGPSADLGRHDSAPIRTIARTVLAGNVQYIVFDAIMKTYFAE
jgi:hypothetical protein